LWAFILQEPIHSMPFNIGLGGEGGAGRSRNFMDNPPACPGRNHNSRSPDSGRLFCKHRKWCSCIFGSARAAVGKKVPFWRIPFWQRSCVQATLNAAWLLERRLNVIGPRSVATLSEGLRRFRPQAHWLRAWGPSSVPGEGWTHTDGTAASGPLPPGLNSTVEVEGP